MKVLVVTGRLAEASARKAVEGVGHQVDVLALPVTVASFITPQYAAQTLKELQLDYDFILLPGTVRGDVSEVAQATGIPSFKGPLHVSNLPLALESIQRLSTSKPADEIILEAIKEASTKLLNGAEEGWRETLESCGGFNLGGLAISPGLPMRILGEVVNAPLLTLQQIANRALYLAEAGADIIDLGMLSGKPMPDKVPALVEAVRGAVDRPVSIDSLDPLEIKAALDCGVEMVLSVDQGNVEEVLPHVSDEALVVLPTDAGKGFMAGTPRERVDLVWSLVERLREAGVSKVVADLVVEPLVRPGMMSGLIAYHLFHSEHPETPTLFGVGNAVELIDADSQGVMAALVCLAAECGASLLHVPEHSDKARGSVSEASTAAKMAFLASSKGTPPKDLGFDLLLLKEKRRVEEPFSGVPEAEKVVYAELDPLFTPDEAGWFKIHVDRRANQLVAVHTKGEGGSKTVVRGSTPEEVYQTIVRLGLVSKLEHAAYLGRELAKAHIALVTGRSYIQDEPLFQDPSQC